MGEIIPSYSDLPQYRSPSSEDYHWKLQYSKVDIKNDTFEYLKLRLEELKIDEKIVSDMINYLNIMINNASKTKIEYYQIPDLLEDFEYVWDSHLINYIKNSRWIVELNDLKSKTELLLKQEYLKAIGGWQGDNMLRTRIESSQSYNVRQEQVVQEQPRRGFFRRKPKVQPPAVQGFSSIPDLGGK